MAASEAEQQPLLQELRTVASVRSQAAGTRQTTTPGQTTASDAGSGEMTRQNKYNILVVNVIAFLLSVAGSLHLLCLHQYVYIRVASDLTGNSNLPKGPCFSNKSSHHLEEEAQRLTSQKLQYFLLAVSIPALFVNLFLGAYSDYIGRRFLFTISVLSYVFQFGVPAVVSYLHLDLNWLFVGYVLTGCFGSFCAFLLAIYVYTADNTPPSSTRTLGMALHGAASSLASLCGELGGGHFIENVGHFWPFLTATILAFISLLIVLCFLAETRPRQPGTRCPSPTQAIRDVFGFYFLKSALSEPGQTQAISGVVGITSPGLRQSADHDERAGPRCPGFQHVVADRRPEFCLGIVIFFLVTLPFLSPIDNLYVMNEPFCWLPSSIGNYNTIKKVVQHCVSPFVLKLLARCMKDEWIGVLGMVSMGGNCLVMALADVEWMLYTAPAVGVLMTLGLFSIRSLMSQRAPTGKQGSLFAGQAVVETVCLAASGVLFNALYAHTISTFRGATYLTMVAISVLAIVCMWFYIRTIRENTPGNVTIQVQDGQNNATYRGL